MCVKVPQVQNQWKCFRMWNTTPMPLFSLSRRESRCILGEQIRDVELRVAGVEKKFRDLRDWSDIVHKAVYSDKDCLSERFIKAKTSVTIVKETRDPAGLGGVLASCQYLCDDVSRLDMIACCWLGATLGAHGFCVSLGAAHVVNISFCHDKSGFCYPFPVVRARGCLGNCISSVTSVYPWNLCCKSVRRKSMKEPHHGAQSRRSSTAA